MKIKKNNQKMSEAEIKAAIKRDKAWMDRIDPDEEIEIPKEMLKGIFGSADESDDGDGVRPSEEDDSEGADFEIDDESDEPENDDNDADENDSDEISSGKVVGALVGGIGGMVLGSILGAALFSDD